MREYVMQKMDIVTISHFSTKIHKLDIHKGKQQSLLFFICMKHMLTRIILQEKHGNIPVTEVI
jgi:hypothetical protein